MKTILAKTAGFCFGVSRAVELVEECIRTGQRAVTLGPIIHNRHVVADLAARGVEAVASMEEIPEGAAVVIRSHGVSRDVYEKIEEKDALILPGIREQLAVGKMVEGVIRKADGSEFKVKFNHPLSARDIELVLAGGRLNCK